MWYKRCRLYLSCVGICIFICIADPWLVFCGQDSIFVDHIVLSNGACCIRFFAITDPCDMYVMPDHGASDTEKHAVIIGDSVANTVIRDHDVQYASYAGLQKISESKKGRVAYAYTEIITMIVGGIVMYVLATGYLSRKKERL